MAGQLLPPAVPGHAVTQSPIFASAISPRYVGTPLFGLIHEKMFWKTVSLYARNSPVRRSIFQRIPGLPIAKTSGRPPTSTSTRSNTSSRSRASPGACCRYHTSRPVSGSRASVELVYSALSLTVMRRLAGTQGFGWATPQ
jgi:hypothetical protein